MGNCFGRLILLVTLVSGSLSSKADYNIRLTNEQYPNATTLEVDIQIQTTSGNFDLGGDFGAIGNITEVFVDYSTRGTSSGQILFDATNSSHALGAGYNVNFFEIQNGRARLRLLYNTGSAVNVTTTYQTIATLSFDVGPNSGTWQQYTMTINTSSVVYDASDNLQTQNSLTGLSNESLPVDLDGLVAMSNGDGSVNLAWHTSFEKNNDGFEIQRSLDAGPFKTIGFVQGQGHSTAVTRYDYHDQDISTQSTIQYYRLKQLDYDGSFSYSGAVAVMMNSRQQQCIFGPNPATSYINFTCAAEVVVFDNLGNQILRTSEQQVNLSMLPKGVYIIAARTESNSGTWTAEKLILQ